MNSSFTAILKGSLDFGNAKTYDLMMAHFQKRLESYYKNDLLLKNPSFFDADNARIDVPIAPRYTVQCSEKTWKNTIGLMREIRTFAVAGKFHIWVLDEKKQLVAGDTIEPQGDKLATTEYLRGLSLLKKEKEKEAVDAFSRAIDKFNRYAQAFAGRGRAYFQAGRFEDALIDYSHSIGIDQNSEAFFGMGEVKWAMGQKEEALADFQTAINNAAPYEPIFWTARRVKGECHFEQNELEKAIFELKLVTKRPFKETDPNFPFRKKAWLTYSAVLTAAGKDAEAKLAIKEAQAIEEKTLARAVSAAV